MLDGEEYFTCVCGEYDHTLRFVLDLDQNEEDHPYPTIYTEVQIKNYKTFWQRIWPGIKYIFGWDIRHPYNCWEINADGEDPDRLIAMLHKLKDQIHSNELKRLEKQKDS